MLLRNCVELFSKNLFLKTLSECGLKATSCSLQYFIPKKHCSCISSRIAGSPTVLPGSSTVSSRYFVAVTNPLCKKAQSREEDDDDDEDNSDEDEPVLSGDKILKVRLLSDRLDAVLKTGLQMSRAKIEKAFFADRIRLNGIRPVKKSQQVGRGDQIDVIRKYNVHQPTFLDVSRVEILDLKNYSRLDHEDSDDEAKMPAKLKRSKTLTIPNYNPPFKGNLDDE